MPDNLQAFKAKWFCWHKVSSLSKCLCSQCLGPHSALTRAHLGQQTAENRRKLCPKVHTIFAPAKQQPKFPKSPRHAAQAPMLPPAFLLSMVATGAHPSSQHPCLASPALCFNPLSKKECNLSLPPGRRMLFPVSERVVPEQPNTCAKPKQMPPPPPPALGSYSKFRSAVAAF